MPASTTRIRVYPWLIGAGVLAAFALHRPELLVLTAPFVVAVVSAAHRDPPTDISVTTSLSAERALEGTPVQLTAVVSARDAAVTLELTPVLARDLTVVFGPRSRRTRVEPGTPRTFTWAIVGRRWGVTPLGALRVRVVEPLAASEPVLVSPASHTLKVLPDAARLRALVAPHRTHGFGGSQRAARAGGGIEFSELRPYQPGDRRRDVNARVSSRRGAPWVSSRHPDESADVVLFVDSFVDIGPAGEAGDREHAAASTLEATVRLALMLTIRFLRDHDRVGLVDFGGFVRWIYPGTGLAHQYRVVDALLDTQARVNFAWKSVALIPARALPPRALVIAISSLVDERARAAVRDLARFDTVAIDVSTAPFASPPRDDVGLVAERLWALMRAQRRDELQRAGVPVLEWLPGQPVEPVIAALALLHRRTRPRRA